MIDRCPKIDTTAAYAKDFVSIMDRESFWQRFRGTMGSRVKAEMKRDAKEAKKRKTGRVHGKLG